MTMNYKQSGTTAISNDFWKETMQNRMQTYQNGILNEK